MAENPVALKTRVVNELSIYLRQEGSLAIHQLKMKESTLDASFHVRQATFGEPNDKPTLVTLFVGATGSGKTTLLNAIVNVLFGVEYSDPFRLVLIDDKIYQKRNQAISQTDIISAYTFYHMSGMPMDFNVVLVDTPGFGDTRGVEQDKFLMSQLETFLKESRDADQVHGIGLVTPASSIRLTPSQQYVYDGITSMFAQDVKENIFVLATFADAAQPAFLDGLKEANIQYAGYYKFNNSALFASNPNSSDGDMDADAMLNTTYWNIVGQGIKSYFTKLRSTNPASLVMTKEVLEKRRLLQEVINNLQAHIHPGLDKMAQLEAEKKMIEQYSSEMQSYSEYEVDIDIPELKIVDPGSAGSEAGNVIIPPISGWCPKSTLASAAVSAVVGVVSLFTRKEGKMPTPPKYETIYKKAKHTLQDIKCRYENAKQKKLDKESIVQALENDIQEHKNLLLNLIDQAREMKKRLDAIALKSNPLSTCDYIDMMILVERQNKQPNYEQRVEMLHKLRQEAKILERIVNNDKPKSPDEVDLQDVLKQYNI